MASEIRVDKINSLSGVGTVTLSPTGVDIAGITTVATLKATTGIVTTLTATTGIVTTLTANTVTSLGAVSGTTGTFSGAVSGTTGTFSGDITANGNIAGDDSTNISGINQVTIGDLYMSENIVHRGDDNTRIRFPSADTVVVETGGSERLRVSSSGKVRVGSGDASYNLDVQGSGQQVVLIGSTNAGGAFITLDGDSNGDGSGTDYCYIGHNTDGNLQIGADNPSGNANIILYAGDNAEKVRIQSSGGISFNGDTATANALDDYEEGTFTPTYSFSSSTGTFTYNAQIGRYTKIGNRCFFSVIVRSVGHSGTSNGLLRIAGLPFNVLSDAPSGGTCFFISGGNFSANYGVATQLVTTEHIEFYKQVTSTGNNYDSIEENELTLGDLFIKVEGHYQVDQ